MCSFNQNSEAFSGHKSGSSTKLTVLGRCLVVLIKGYQLLLSPLFPPSCRYVPSCSRYALDAVCKYGAFRGTWMAVLRILRCHPFSRGGYDPVD